MQPMHAKNGFESLPTVIGIRTQEFTPLLRKWRKANPRVQWKLLLMRGLTSELKPFASKRTEHLFADAAREYARPTPMARGDARPTNGRKAA